MKSTVLRKAFLLLPALLVAMAAWGRPVLPKLFSDHMVLQSDHEIVVWGWGTPGETIRVSIGNQHARVITGQNRCWRARLRPLPVGGPYTLVIRGEATIFVKDVLIGEVWIASGQSNMTYAVGDAIGGAEAVSKADYQQIRLLTVPRRIALTPQSDSRQSYWKICSPESVRTFSAVAYSFARTLHSDLRVPVGIIVSAWPGTTIEEWMPESAFRGDPELATIFTKRKKVSPDVKRFSSSGLPVDLEFKAFEFLPSGADGAASTELQSERIHLEVPGEFFWSYGWNDAPATSFELSDSDSTASMRVHGSLNFPSQSLLVGRLNRDGSVADLSKYGAVRFQVRGTGGFRLRFLQPTIVDTDDYASGFITAELRWRTVVISFRDLHQEGWGVAERFTPEQTQAIAIESVATLPYPERPIAGLFNGMIAPLLPFPFRGVLWYQGESNALAARRYRKQLPALIESWRRGAGQTDFSFLIVQLPGHGNVQETPGESAWAELREAQAEAANNVPNTGLIVTIDLGDARNVHPPRKFEVGERLALWALGTTYQRDISHSSPVFESMQILGPKVTISFKNLRGSLRTSDGGPVTGFAIAGKDGKFVWADATIVGNQVFVSAPAVPTPVAVRYGWGNSPKCNLVDESGLPAAPFRTDSSRP